MFGQNREQLRRFYQDVWLKHTENRPLAGVEVLIAQVIRQHPEYHEYVTRPDALDRDFGIESGQINPFLHMGMHITLAEQLQADRPAGIREQHQRLSNDLGDPHEAEHRMMECLGLILWEAQRNNTVPDEQAYLACIRKLEKR